MTYVYLLSNYIQKIINIYWKIILLFKIKADCRALVTRMRMESGKFKMKNGILFYEAFQIKYLIISPINIQIYYIYSMNSYKCNKY